MPGYPYFLAIFKQAFDKFSNYLFAVRSTQAVIGALTGCLVFYLSRILFSNIFAWVITVFFIFNPLHAASSSFVLTETIFSLCLFLMILFLILYAQTEKMKWLIFSGLSFGASLYFRESVLLLPLCYAIVFSFFKRYRRYVLSALAIFAMGIFLLIPWVLRNYSLTGDFILLTTNGGVTLYDSVGPSADGSSDFTKFKQAKQIPGDIRGESERDRWWRKEALQAIRQKPGRLIRLAFVKLGRFWNIALNHTDFKKPLFDIAFGVYYIPVLFLFLIGLLWRTTFEDIFYLIILVPVLYYSFLHTIFIGSLRYRMPIEPFILMIAILGFRRLLENGLGFKT